MIKLIAYYTIFEENINFGHYFLGTEKGHLEYKTPHSALPLRYSRSKKTETDITLMNTSILHKTIGLMN